jgi:hypothetical protein
VLSTNSNEVASFGNIAPNAYMRVYDNNTPLATGYVMGLSNSMFTITKGSAPTDTQVGIGTFINTTSAQLQVQGTLATSNITSYLPNKTIYFGGMNVAGISNIDITGNITVSGVTFGSGQWDGYGGSNIFSFCNIGIGTKIPVGALEVKGTSFFMSNVGIGTYAAPSNLTVEGTAIVSGTLTAGRIIDQSAQSGSYNSWSLYNGDVGNITTVYTNDPIATNRVLFAFSLLPGYYLINGNIPFKNLTSFVTIDTVNWASIGLYKCSPGQFTDSLTPVYSVPLMGLGGDATDFDTCSFTTFVNPEEANGTAYVIAITGRGHELQFGGVGLPSPMIYTIPVRGIGVNDSISVRQALQMSPIRATLTSAQGQTSIPVATTGVFSADGSNVDLYINGTKYIWRDSVNSDYTVSTSILNNVTTFNINLSTPLDAGNEIDVLVWPNMNSSNFFSSGYLYQTVNNYSVKWLNVAGGGVRTGERLIVDGDLFVGGNVFFGCNTTVFPSGAVWSGDNTQITSNIIGSGNIIDGSITTSKIVDGAVTNAKFADGTITNSKIALGAITTNLIGDQSITVGKLNSASFGSSNVGFGVTTPRSQLHVNGGIMTNTSVAVNAGNTFINYDFQQAPVGGSTAVALQTSNMTIGRGTGAPIICIEAANLISTLPSGGTMSTGWAPYSVATAAPTYFTTGGYLGGSYVRFVGDNFGFNNSLTLTGGATFNIGSAGGFTAIALIRFDQFTANDGDRIFSLSGGSLFFHLYRNTSDVTALTLNVNGTITTLASGVVNTNEWAVFAITIPATSGAPINLYKNGRFVGSATTSSALNSSYTFTSVVLGWNGAGGGSARYGNYSMGGLMMYEGVLAPEQMMSVTNHLMQGNANVVGNTRPLLQANPVPYVSGDALIGAPAPNVDITGNLRVRALPADPVWVVDAYAPTSRFLNTTSSTLPTFNITGNLASMGIDFVPGRTLVMEPGYFRMGTFGMTIFLKFRFNTPSVTANEVLLYLGADATPVGSANPFILIDRNGSTNSVRVTYQKSNAANQSTNLSSSSIFNQLEINTLAITIDPSARGSITMWVNGAINQTSASLSTSAFGLFADTYLGNVYIGSNGILGTNSTIYTAAVYNRALTATEIRQAFTTLASDTPSSAPTSSTDIASRTGRTALGVSCEGYVAPFTMSPDNIPGLIGYLPFDNHLFDATVGINWLSAPTVTGKVQFNNKGRVGASVVLTNAGGSTPTATNYLAYPVNYTFNTGIGFTVAFWFKYYTRDSFAYSALMSFLTPSNNLALNIIVFEPSYVRINLTDQISTNVGLNTAFTTNPNTWYHYVLTVSNNTVTVYLNGVASSIATSLQQCTLSRFFLGCKSTDNSQPLNGELDDVRIYNRVLSASDVQSLISVPVTSPSIQFNSAGTGTPNFSVNTGAAQIMAPIQLSQTTTIDSAITNSSNLSSTINVSAQGYQLTDLTGIQQNIALGTGMSLSSQGPFGSSNIPEGSIVFTNTAGSYISSSNSRYSFNWWQNGGFTLEMWVNYSSFATATATGLPTLIGLMNPNNGTNYWSFGATTTNKLLFYYWAGASGTVSIISTQSLATNTWYHIAVACDTTTTRIYINGSLDNSASVTGLNTPGTLQSVGASAFTIGAHNNVQVTASIASLRLVQGAALYTTSSFTVPTTPLAPATSGTTLMLLRNSLNVQTPMSLTSTGDMTLAGNISAGNLGMFRNRIINGDMRIDQRNEGVLQTGVTSGMWAADRMRLTANNLGTYSIQRITTDAPPGFTHSIQTTVTTIGNASGTGQMAYYNHRIEGFNIADLNFGTPYATPIVISFWTKSSVVGTYGVSVDNGAAGGRGYTTTFRVNVANVWERAVVYIPGDTIGTWNNTNSLGMRVCISLGCSSDFNNLAGNDRWTVNSDKPNTSGNVVLSSTIGATFLFTGLQLEKGTIPTPFEYRPHPIELQLCQRYCTRFVTGGSAFSRFNGTAVGTAAGSASFLLATPTQLRIAPDTGLTGGNLGLVGGGTNFSVTIGSLVTGGSSPYSLYFSVTNANIVSGTMYHLFANNSSSAFVQIDVEI